MITFENIMYYVIGYIVTLTFLAICGKRYLGIDYDGEKTYADHDDWDSNAQAYTSWCIGWPLVWIFVGVYLIWKGLMLMTNSLIKITNNEVDSKK